MSFLAIVDLGSNSTRFVIEEVTADGQVEEVLRQKQDTRLAEGMTQNAGYLQPAAIERVVTAVRGFYQIYQKYPAIEVIGIATAAVREALNKNDLLLPLYSEFGINVRVLTGDQEAYYDYLGTESTLALSDAWLLDTGGASVELVGIEKQMAANFISLPFGAVNLAERFHLDVDGLLEQRNLDAAIDFIDQKYAELPWLETDQLPIVLLGGANRTLARLNRKRQGLPDEEDFHGYHLATSRVAELFNELCQLTLQQRAECLGSEANRADIIIGGLLPLMRLIEITNSKEVIFSSSGVREGILQEYVLEQM